MDALYIWKPKSKRFLVLREPTLTLLKTLSRLDQMFDECPNCHAVFKAKAEAARDLYKICQP